MKYITIYFILLIISFFIGCKNNYEKGMEFLKNNEYEKALYDFQKLDSINKDYEKAKSKINYINGVINFNKNNLVTAYEYFNLVNNDDEYYKEAKILINNIEANSLFNYEYGLKYFNQRDYKKALKYFDKIKEGDDNFNKASNKSFFIWGKELYDKKDYNKAWTTLYNIDSSDECYNDAKELMEKIDIALIPEKIKNHCIYIGNTYDAFLALFSNWGNSGNAYYDAMKYKSELEKVRDAFKKNINKDKKLNEPLIKEYENATIKWMDYLIWWIKFFKEYRDDYRRLGVFYSDEWNHNLEVFRKERAVKENLVNSIKIKLGKKYNF